jgi:hypothetical protein
MRSPEGDQCPFAGAVRARDTIEINFNFSGRTAVGKSFRQTVCPLPNKLSF